MTRSECNKYPTSDISSIRHHAAVLLFSKHQLLFSFSIQNLDKVRHKNVGYELFEGMGLVECMASFQSARALTSLFPCSFTLLPCSLFTSEYNKSSTETISRL